MKNEPEATTEMNEEELDKEIDTLTKQKVLELLKETPNKDNKDEFFMTLQQAKLGMLYKRDREIMKRVSNSQVIRVVTLISNNEEERKKYIKASMPTITNLMLPEGN